MQSIDFTDFEPALQAADGETLVQCLHFHVEKLEIASAREAAPAGAYAIVTVLAGLLRCGDQDYRPGDFFLIPATLEDRTLHPVSGLATVLRTTIP